MLPTCFILYHLGNLRATVSYSVLLSVQLSCAQQQQARRIHRIYRSSRRGALRKLRAPSRVCVSETRGGSGPLGAGHCPSILQRSGGFVGVRDPTAVGSGPASLGSGPP